MQEEQQAIRLTGLGGTDLVALMGESSYRSPIDVWREKRGELPPFDGNERTEWGQILEPVLADRYQRDTGHVLRPFPTLRSKANPWHLGTPDRGVYLPEGSAPRIAAAAVASEDGYRRKWIYRPVRALEIKTHGSFAFKAQDYGEEGTDEVPDDKRIQGAWYMPLLEVDVIDFAVLADTHLYRVYRAERDRELEAYMLEEADLFWRNHVLAGEPPDPDGSEGFKKYLAHRFREHDLELVEADDETAELCYELARVKKELKAIEARKGEIEQRIQLAIGAHAGLTYGDKVLATWKRDQRGRVRHTEIISALVDRCSAGADVRAAVELLVRQKEDGIDGEIADAIDAVARFVADVEVSPEAYARIEDGCRGEPSRRFLPKVKA